MPNAALDKPLAASVEKNEYITKYLLFFRSIYIILGMSGRGERRGGKLQGARQGQTRE